MSGNVAVALLSTGTLLLYVECNRPGRVLPGAAGLLLLLLGAHRLTLLPMRRGSLAVLLLAAAAVLSSWWRFARNGPSRSSRIEIGLKALAGAAILAFASGFFPARAGEPARWFAALCGGVLGATSSVLLSLAGQARRAKFHMHAKCKGAGTAGAPERWNAAAPEHWGAGIPGRWE